MRLINIRLSTNMHMANVNDPMPIVLFSLLKAIMYLVHILPEKCAYCNFGNFCFLHMRKSKAQTSRAADQCFVSFVYM